MLTVVLIDDEKNALEVLQLQLEKFCTGVQVIACCDSGEGGIAAIKKHNPQLVFLDIEMPHVNGFDVLSATSQFNYDVVFTTAYDQFAIKAFKFCALDYLLKPVDINELQAAVEKAKKKSDGGLLKEKLQQLLIQLRPPAKNEKVALPVADSMQFVNATDILRCESESNYTHIILTNGKKITTAKTLKEVEASLQGFNFFRVHQSHLVNMDHINKVIRGDGSYILMDDGSTVAISRNKKESFFESFRRL